MYLTTKTYVLPVLNVRITMPMLALLALAAVVETALEIALVVRVLS
jgi:hypothetical protein